MIGWYVMHEAIKYDKEIKWHSTLPINDERKEALDLKNWAIKLLRNLEE